MGIYLDELGGFAETPDAIDAENEKEFQLFNYFLALDYFGAVVGEEFSQLGEDLNDGSTWRIFMNDVCNWIDYNGNADEDYKNNFPKLLNGTIITYQNRTFLEACLEHGWLRLVHDLSSYYDDSMKAVQMIKKKTHL